MSLDSESRRVIMDSLAAIGLIDELLNDQRQALEAILRCNKQIPPTLGRSAPANQDGRHHRKGPPTTLRVSLDGQTITELYAAASMVRTIEFIGLARVERLALKLGGQPLIVRGAEPSGRGYHRSGTYWIATHSDTSEKRNVLEEICRRLGLSCSIEQIPRHPPTAGDGAVHLPPPFRAIHKSPVGPMLQRCR